MLKKFIIHLIIWILLFGGMAIQEVDSEVESPEIEKPPMICINDTLYKLYGPLPPNDPVIEALRLTDLKINEVNYKVFPPSEGTANFGEVNMKVYEGEDENAIYVKLKDVYLVLYKIDKFPPPGE